jgi:hypothetical protein
MKQNKEDIGVRFSVREKPSVPFPGRFLERFIQLPVQSPIMISIAHMVGQPKISSA